MVRGRAIVALGLCWAMLAACQQSPLGQSEAAANGPPLVASNETLDFGGNEPFWGGTVSGERLIWRTPENIDGTDISIQRFEGLGGVSWTGSLDGASFDLMATEGICSDGMSDRTYPITVTVKLGDRLLNGCGHTERLPFKGPAAP